MTKAWTSRELVKNKPANSGAMNLETVDSESVSRVNGNPLEVYKQNSTQFNSSSAFVRLRVQNIFEMYKSGDWINQSESYYNNPYLARKDGSIF